MNQKDLETLMIKQINTKTLSKSNLLICNSYRLREFLLNDLSEIFNCEIIRVDNKVDNVRSAIKEIMTTHNFQVYAFIDIDQASSQTKNSLLKVCEDNKHKLIFICSSSLDSVPFTLSSRCQLLDIQPFSQVDISKFLKENCIVVDNNLIPFIQNLDDIDDKISFKEYYDFCIKILSAFKNVSLSNILKSSKQVKTTQTSSGFEISILIRIMSKITIDDLIENKLQFFGEIEKYYKFLEILSTSLSKLNIKSASKSYIFDNILIGGFSLCN